MNASCTTTVLATFFALGLGACAAGRKSEPTAASPAAEPAQAGAAAAYPQPQALQQPGAPQPPPPPDSPATSPGGFAPAPNRSVALTIATNDIEASQRELDVAGGDCRNACRALGSMDRAAGRLCGLAQSNDEQRRCVDAKTRVYSARDKVRNTCGACPEVSVDRNDPIPSR